MKNHMLSKEAGKNGDYLSDELSVSISTLFFLEELICRK